MKPEHRGRGIGRMLVEKAEEYVKQHDPQRLHNGSPPRPKSPQLLAPHGLQTPKHNRASKEPRRRGGGDTAYTTTKPHARYLPLAQRRLHTTRKEIPKASRGVPWKRKEWRRAAENIRLSARGVPLKYINRTVELVE